MSERKLYSIFQKKIREADPNCFWWKIPDTFNLGGKKCFDGILISNGVPFAIEFKSKDGVLTKYQSYCLTDFINAGGEALIFWEGKESMDDFVEHIISKRQEKKSLDK